MSLLFLLCFLVHGTFSITIPSLNDNFTVTIIVTVYGTSSQEGTLSSGDTVKRGTLSRGDTVKRGTLSSGDTVMRGHCHES